MEPITEDVPAIVPVLARPGMLIEGVGVNNNTGIIVGVFPDYVVCRGVNEDKFNAGELYVMPWNMVLLGSVQPDLDAMAPIVEAFIRRKYPNPDPDHRFPFVGMCQDENGLGANVNDIVSTVESIPILPTTLAQLRKAAAHFNLNDAIGHMLEMLPKGKNIPEASDSHWRRTRGRRTPTRPKPARKTSRAPALQP